MRMKQKTRMRDREETETSNEQKINKNHENHDRMKWQTGTLFTIRSAQPLKQQQQFKSNRILQLRKGSQKKREKKKHQQT